MGCVLKAKKLRKKGHMNWEAQSPKHKAQGNINYCIRKENVWDWDV